MTEYELEQHLRGLAPAQPRPSLADRIGGELASQPLVVQTARVLTAGRVERPAAAPVSWWVRLLPYGLSASVGAMVAILSMLWWQGWTGPSVRRPSATVAQAESLFEPAESSREVIASADGFTAGNSDLEPSQVQFLSSVERYVWRNPATGAELAVEVPREDLVLTSTAYQ